MSLQDEFDRIKASAPGGGGGGGGGGAPPGEGGKGGEAGEEEIPKYGLGNLLDHAFKWLGKREGGQELADRLAFEEEEKETINEATYPLVKKITEWLKISLEEFNGMLALVVIVAPRIGTLAEVHRKNAEKKKGKGENQKGKEDGADAAQP